MDNTSAGINSNTILAYKLLSDAWGEEDDVFKDLMKNEMKYLVSGISLLQNDPYLQMHFGQNLQGAEKIANILQSKVNELNIRSRLEPTANALLYNNFALNPGLRPGASDGVQLNEDLGLEMNVKRTGNVRATRNPVENMFNAMRNEIDIDGINNYANGKKKKGSRTSNQNNTELSNSTIINSNLH